MSGFIDEATRSRVDGVLKSSPDLFRGAVKLTMTLDPGPSKLLDNVVQSRAGARVERAHGIPHHGSYDNGTHTHGVLMLLYYLFPEHFSRLAAVTMAHDLPEAWFGDLPAPTMRYVPGLKDTANRIETALNHSMGMPAEADLSMEDLAMLKACDRLELYLWAREQLLFGNRFVGETLTELRRFFRETPLPPAAQAFFEEAEASELLPRQAGVMKALCEPA